jgi:AcrR family transcriptional regulator
MARTIGSTAEITRDRILEAARELFAERGYAGTSLADIAAAVGLTKTAVAYHFHPKDRLAAWNAASTQRGANGS